MDDRFSYVLVLPDHAEGSFTPFGGFSPGLMGFEWALQIIPTLPADVWEPALPISARVNRKLSGQGAYRWLPLGVDVLPQWPDSDAYPLRVIFTQDEAVSAAVERWSDSLHIRPLHVSATPTGQALEPRHLNRARLAAFATQVIAVAGGIDGVDLLDAVRRWPAERRRRSKLRFQSHNVTVPNEMALLTEGLQPSRARVLNPLDDEHYVRSIRDSVRAVRELRSRGGAARASRAYPSRPDLILFAPAMYRAYYQRMRLADEPLPGVSQALRILQAQRGYAFQTDKPQDIAALDQPGWHMVNQTRSAELRLQSAGVGMICASTLAAAIRLPARINRVRGVVGQLAKHLRAHPDAEQKTARVFGLVQAELAQAIDPRLLSLIKQSKDGMRIVADAPLEWLAVDGLPLALRHQVSRINATPGNLSFGELVNSPTQIFRPEAFEEILLISSFGADDPLREQMHDALEMIAPGAGVRIRRVEVGSRSELIAALNGFSGLMAIFDAHGGQEHGRPGTLAIGSDQVDAWGLRGLARMPPIIVLSACDTHAVDGSHATVANGLIASGARAVLGTFLPVRGLDSAVFVARLVIRARMLTEIVNRTGRSMTWARVVTDMMRTQLMTDVLRPLVGRPGLQEQSTIEALLFEAGARVSYGHSDWWEAFVDDLGGATPWGEGELETQLDRAIAASDVIRYVHVGAPETIVISSQAIFDDLAKGKPR